MVESMTRLNYEYHHMGQEKVKNTVQHLKCIQPLGTMNFAFNGIVLKKVVHYIHLFNLSLMLDLKSAVLMKLLKERKCYLNLIIHLKDFEPYYPFEGFRVVMVEIDGAPVEFIETNLSEDEILGESHKGSVIYPENT